MADLWTPPELWSPSDVALGDVFVEVSDAGPNPQQWAAIGLIYDPVVVLRSVDDDVVQHMVIASPQFGKYQKILRVGPSEYRASRG